MLIHFCLFPTFMDALHACLGQGNHYFIYIFVTLVAENVSPSAVSNSVHTNPKNSIRATDKYLILMLYTYYFLYILSIIVHYNSSVQLYVTTC